MKKTQKKTQKKKSSGKLIKKPTQKEFVGNAITVASLLGGVLFAGGVHAMIPDEYDLPAQGGIAIAGTVGSTFFSDKTIKGKILKNIATGAALTGTYNIVTDLLKEGKQADPDATGIDKFVQGAIGLSCPGGCNGRMYNQPAYVPALGNPMLIETVYDEDTDTYSVGNSAKNRI